MSGDRTPKRKSAAKRDSASPSMPASQTPAKKKRPKPQTADQLEALLHLLDGDEVSDATPKAARKPRQTTSGRASRPARKKTPAADEASSFMQELARARADLHKERRARIALEEEVESLRSKLARLADNDSAKLDELRRESQDLRKQLATIEKQCLKLKNSLLHAESQLDAEQAQRRLSSEQVAALTERLEDAESNVGEHLAALADLETSAEASHREVATIREQLAAAISELEAAHSARTELERAVETAQRDDREAAAKNQEIAKAGEQARTDLTAQLNSLQSQLAAANSELEAAHSARTELEQVVETAQHDYREAAAKNEEVAKAGEQARMDLTAQLDSLQVQLADANQKLADSTADRQQLRVELTDARREKQTTAVSLDEMTVANKQLEKRVDELEAKLAASNQLLAQSQNDLQGTNERIEQLQTDAAKLRTDLAESYEQLGAARIRLANSDRDRDHAQQREAEAVRKADELSDEVKSLQAAVQREAAARRKSESIRKREAGEDAASALFEAEQKIERLSRELAASRGVEAAYQQRAARKVQQVQQELETLRQRLAEIEKGPAES